MASPQLTSELWRLGVMLVFIVAAAWFGIYVLPDILTEIFRNTLDLP